MSGYYNPDVNWSVEKHNNQWIMRVRLTQDTIATTDEQIAVINSYIRSNKENYYSRECNE